MDPVTVGLAILQIGGGLAQAKAEKAAAEYKALIFERNALIADYGAADAVARGAVDEAKAQLETGSTIAKQQTAYAASGVRADTGSPADVVGTTRALGDLTAATIRSNAARAAWGYENEATNFRQQAKLSRMGGAGAADSALITGYTRAAAQFRHG